MTENKVNEKNISNEKIDPLVNRVGNIYSKFLKNGLINAKDDLPIENINSEQNDDQETSTVDNINESEELVE